MCEICFAEIQNFSNRSYFYKEIDRILQSPAFLVGAFEKRARYCAHCFLVFFHDRLECEENLFSLFNETKISETVLS